MHSLDAPHKVKGSNPGWQKFAKGHSKAPVTIGKLGSKLGFELGFELGFSILGGKWDSKSGVHFSQTQPGRREGTPQAVENGELVEVPVKHTILPCHFTILFPFMFISKICWEKRGPSGRDGRAALKDTLPLRELRREMEQDCAAAAHQQQAVSLGQACLLACGRGSK
eukprot:28605-Pelagomonas_calceolata.AAC.6